MTDFELVTATDVQLMQGMAQRVTATRPDLISAGASYGELAWIWGKGRAPYGATWPRRLWFPGAELVAWSWAFLPHQVRRNDGSVTDITGASLSYQVGATHATVVCLGSPEHPEARGLYYGLGSGNSRWMRR
jgi:hypothetical protein